MLADAGVQSVKLPQRSPKLNAYAERFVQSIKESCLDQMILFGENSLRKAIQEFVVHYHLERNHQGLGNREIMPEKFNSDPQGPLECRERLGGMLKYYHRAAA
jgi:putative transposase